MIPLFKKLIYKKDGGFAIVWILGLIAIVTALSLVFLQKAGIGTEASAKRCDSMKAQYLAEAAANHAMWRLLKEEDFPEKSDTYYMHSLGNGRYGYKVRRHTNTTFATVATVGNVNDIVVRQSYVLYVKDRWYDPAWHYRQKISISPDVADTDLANFPYMVNISDAGNGLFLNAQLSSGDILFTDSQSSVKLDHEIEKYVGLEGKEELVAWVKIPNLASGVTTEINMYYGNGSASDQENTAAVWSNGYEAVYHLHDDFNDSLNNHNGTNNNSSDTTGRIGDARDFYPDDGVDSINIGTWDLDNISTFTLQAWIKSDDNFAQTYPRAISKAGNTSEQDHVWSMSLTNGTTNVNRLRFRLKTGNTDTAGTTTMYGDYPNGYLPDPGEWYLVAMTYNGSLMRIIRDGLDAGSTYKSGTIRRNSWEINIGNVTNNTNTTYCSWDGKIDEVRISTVARSIDWMEAEYRNQGSPGAYQSLWAEESRGLGGATLLEAHFDTDDEEFIYMDDVFRSTSAAPYASGSYISAGGYSGGALKVTLGGIDNAVILGMSGGWRQAFSLAADSEVRLTFLYKLTQSSEYESDEYGQALVSVDGTLYGEGASDTVCQINGDGNGGTAESSGWHRFHVHLGTLSAGNHMVTIGGYNNKKTYNDESVEILIDDVLILR